MFFYDNEMLSEGGYVMNERIESILETSCIVIHDDVKERLMQVVLDECLKVRVKQKDKDMISLVLILKELRVGKEDMCFFLERYYLLGEDEARVLVEHIHEITNHIAHVNE